MSDSGVQNWPQGTLEFTVTREHDTFRASLRGSQGSHETPWGAILIALGRYLDTQGHHADQAAQLFPGVTTPRGHHWEDRSQARDGTHWCLFGPLGNGLGAAMLREDLGLWGATVGPAVTLYSESLGEAQRDLLFLLRLGTLEPRDLLGKLRWVMSSTGASWGLVDKSGKVLEIVLSTPGGQFWGPGPQGHVTLGAAQRAAEDHYVSTMGCGSTQAPVETPEPPGGYRWEDVTLRGHTTLELRGPGDWLRGTVHSHDGTVWVATAISNDTVEVRYSDSLAQGQLALLGLVFSPPGARP